MKTLKRTPFLDLLKKHPVVFDGAMGTVIYQKGIFIDKCYDALNLSNPDLIGSIHEAYIRAGAEVIETNTFGANRFKLNRFGLSHQITEMNQAGTSIARRIIGEEGYVAASIGPLGVNVAPWGEITLEESGNAFREQASALAGTDIDLFILETFQNIDELEQAIRAVREVSDLPIIAQMSFQEEGRTLYGTSPGEMIGRLNDLPVEVIGFNCVLGPKQYLDILEEAVQWTEKPVSVMPNAGYPQWVEGRMLYMSTPDYFGVYAARFIQAGAQVIGGCCGTTPEHIQKMAEAVKQKHPRIQKRRNLQSSRVVSPDLPAPVPAVQKSILAEKLIHKKNVTLVEMVTPRGFDISKQIEGAEKLKSAGIDAINIPDGPRASARMNSLAMAILLQNQVHIETVLHYTCRDRNILGIQSDLLGASALGIRNILAITGDPPKMGDYPEATAVFDIDSIGLTRGISSLNHGLDIGNKPIGQPTAFFVGVGVDPNSINPDEELARFHQKLEAGAEFAITQPVFSLDALESFLSGIRGITIPVIAGIWPLISLRNAEFMKNEVPGVVVPDSVIRRMSGYQSSEDQLKAGIEIAREMVMAIRQMIQGIQISAPFGRVTIALEVAEAAK